MLLSSTAKIMEGSTFDWISPTTTKDARIMILLEAYFPISSTNELFKLSFPTIFKQQFPSFCTWSVRFPLISQVFPMENLSYTVCLDKK